MSTRAAPPRATSSACEAPAGSNRSKVPFDWADVAVATQYREGHQRRPGADPLRQRVVATTGRDSGAKRACQERPWREPLAEFDE